MATKQKADTGALKPEQTVKHTLEKMQPQFKALLPSPAHVDRFIRNIMISVQGNPDLLEADRDSLYRACMECAREGLLPDKKEAVLQVYNTNVGTRQQPKWVKVVQYQPMVAGMFKKLRNSKEVAGAPNVQVVYDGDEFTYQLGDDPKIIHVPDMKQRGEVIAAYSIVKLIDGEISREVMSREEIDGIRDRSKAKDAGPWVTDFAEMCRKTVFKRHCKRLPSSTELDKVIEHDNQVAGYTEEFIAETPAAPQLAAPETRPAPLQAALDKGKGKGKAEPEPQPAAAESKPEHDELNPPPIEGESEEII